MAKADRQSTEIRFQDAGGDVDYLLEALLESCASATSGGAIFAWANASGVKAFFGSPGYERFQQEGEFRLVVGLDSITDLPAVEALRKLEERWKGFAASAFVHKQSALFHPKMAWFRGPWGLRLIVGSGNLTTGGLKSNWEAFTVSHLGAAEARQILDRIDAWLASWYENLLPITDPRVAELAKANAGSERSLKGVKRRARQEPVVTHAIEDVLVAEIPRAGDRWRQANFDLENYRTFFGAEVGTQRQILLYHVKRNGDIGDLEIRPSVEVRSHNYRFELAAAEGEYPEDGPPIGVFLRLETGQFVYMLLLPGQRGYPEISAFLDRTWSGRAGRMRRVRSGADQVISAWPESPLWRVEAPEL